MFMEYERAAGLVEQPGSAVMLREEWAFGLVECRTPVEFNGMGGIRIYRITRADAERLIAEKSLVESEPGWFAVVQH